MNNQVVLLLTKVMDGFQCLFVPCGDNCDGSRRGFYVPDVLVSQSFALVWRRWGMCIYAFVFFLCI
jgi:hypothetical protein